MTEQRDAVEPQLAASVILLRGEAPFEVLMMRRSERSSFVPGAWVFPGGTVDEADRLLAAEIAPAGDQRMTALRICAVREMLEEAGVWPGKVPDNLLQLRRALLSSAAALTTEPQAVARAIERLVWTSRWITPTAIPKRFDTCFFLAKGDEGAAVATPDELEAVELAWITPSDALERYRRSEMEMVFPTVKNLEAIVSAPSASVLIESRKGAHIPTHQPVVVENGGRKVIVLPE